MRRNLRDVNAAETRWTVFLYGDSGVGKTCAAATWPRPMLFLETDPDGLLPLAGEDIDFEEFLDEDPRKPHAFRDLTKTVDELRKLESFPYQTVVLDSLTTVAEACLREIMRLSGKGMSTKPTWDEYYQLNDKLHELLTAFLGLPCNVILTGHVELEKDELTGEIWVMTLLSGAKKMRHRMPLYFSEVYFLEKDRDAKGNDIYLCHISAPRRRQYAKSRKPNLKGTVQWDRWSDPLFPKLQALVRGELRAEEPGKRVKVST